MQSAASAPPRGAPVYFYGPRRVPKPTHWGAWLGVLFEGLVPTCWLVGARDGCGGLNMSLCPLMVAAPFCVPAVGFEDCYGFFSSRYVICAPSPQDRPRLVPPPARKIGLGGPGTGLSRVGCRPRTHLSPQERGQVCAGSGLQELQEELYEEL